jgi:hypothetical protein
MKARQLINSAPLGPDALKFAGQAFDEAWGADPAVFGNDPIMIEGARLTLANAILSAAGDERRDVGSLKRAGIQAMIKQYKSLSNYSSPATEH